MVRRYVCSIPSIKPFIAFEILQGRSRSRSSNNNKKKMLRLQSLSITAGPLYKVTQTVKLSGNEMLNIKVLSSRRKLCKMKLFAGRPGECSVIALQPQESFGAHCCHMGYSYSAPADERERSVSDSWLSCSLLFFSPKNVFYRTFKAKL